MFSQQLKELEHRLRSNPNVRPGRVNVRVDRGAVAIDRHALQADIDEDAAEAGLVLPGVPVVPDFLLALQAELKGFSVEWWSADFYGAELFHKGPDAASLDAGEVRWAEDKGAAGALRWNLLAAYPGGFEYKLLVELFPTRPDRYLWLWQDDGARFPLSLNLERWWSHMLAFGAYSGWERLFIDLDRMEGLRRAGSRYGRPTLRPEVLHETARALVAIFGEETGGVAITLAEEYEILR